MSPRRREPDAAPSGRVLLMLGSIPIGALARTGLHLASVLGIVVVMLRTPSLPGRH